jgi:hypothetical protein
MATDKGISQESLGRKDRTAPGLATVFARARSSGVPTFAPRTYRRAVAEWRTVESGESSDPSAIAKIESQLAEAVERAGRAKGLLADLVRVRSDLLRGSSERRHAPEVLSEAEGRYSKAIESAEAGDEARAREHATAAGDLYREATIRSIERGSIASLEARIAEAGKAGRPEEIRSAETELAEIQEAAADTRRGNTTVTALRARVAAGRIRIGRDIDDLLGDGGILTDPLPPGEPGVAGAPDPVLTMRVTARTENSLTVTWLDRSNLDEANQLLRQRNGGPWETAADLGALSNWTTYVDTGLQPDSLYCYRVRSENVQGVATTPMNDRACGYTRDGNGIRVWRIQLRVRTADVSDAGTSDAVQVRLTSPLATYNPTGNRRWLDYGPRWEGGGLFGWRDDFARNREFTYDLDQSYISELSDISMLTIAKDGSDGVAIAEIALLVNERECFSRVFGESSSTCLWLDNEDGHSTSYTITLSELRAHPSWQAFVASPPGPPFRIPNEALVGRIEGMIGHAIHGTDVGWGEFNSPAWVEATFLDDERLRVDVDLEADFPILGDPEVDINFDLRFWVECNSAAGTATLHVDTENFSTNVDFGFFSELFGGFAFEDDVADRVRAAFQPIAEAIELETGNLCPSVRVEQNGDVAFQLGP